MKKRREEPDGRIQEGMTGRSRKRMKQKDLWDISPQEFHDRLDAVIGRFVGEHWGTDYRALELKRGVGWSKVSILARAARVHITIATDGIRFVSTTPVNPCKRSVDYYDWNDRDDHEEVIRCFERDIALVWDRLNENPSRMILTGMAFPFKKCTVVVREFPEEDPMDVVFGPRDEPDITPDASNDTCSDRYEERSGPDVPDAGSLDGMEFADDRTFDYESDGMPVSEMNSEENPDEDAQGTRDVLASESEMAEIAGTDGLFVPDNDGAAMATSEQDEYVVDEGQWLKDMASGTDGGVSVSEDGISGEDTRTDSDDDVCGLEGATSEFDGARSSHVSSLEREPLDLDGSSEEPVPDDDMPDDEGGVLGTEPIEEQEAKPDVQFEQQDDNKVSHKKNRGGRRRNRNKKKQRT